jgi:alpha-glucosidase
VNTRRAATRCTCVTRSNFWRPIRLTPARVSEVLKATSLSGRHPKAGPVGPSRTMTWSATSAAGATTFSTDDSYAKMASAILLMSQRGTVCIYQGEELGARPRPSSTMPISRIPTASSSGPNSRAGTAAARRWCGRARHCMAGFSTARRPWLPIPVEPHSASGRCRCRTAIPASVLQHYRRFLAFRKAAPGIGQGRDRIRRAEGLLARLQAPAIRQRDAALPVQHERRSCD